MLEFLFKRLVPLAMLATAALAGAAEAAPSWWRVSDGRSEVWILGVPRVTPRDFSFDTASLDRRLAQSRTLIVGPRPEGGFKAAGLILANFVDLRSPRPLEDTLSPNLRQRFVALRQQLDKPARRYSGWKPVVAGLWLSNDFYEVNALQAGGLEAAVVKYARGKGVRDMPAGSFDPSAVMASAKTLNEGGQMACLEATVHDLERGAEAYRAVTQAWARGETGDLPIDHVDRACLNALPAIGTQTDQTMNQETAAVVQALGQAGHTVAVFDLRNLTIPGGLLDRWRARGLQVSGPTP